MLVISLTTVSSLLVSGVSSFILQNIDGQLHDVSLRYNFSTTLISSNSSNSPSNFSTNFMGLHCDEFYGTQLQSASCLDALRYVVANPSRRSFGKRGIGRPDIGLPYRFLSCKLPHFSRVGQIGHPVSFSDVSGSGRSVSN